MSTRVRTRIEKKNQPVEIGSRGKSSLRKADQMIRGCLIAPNHVPSAPIKVHEVDPTAQAIMALRTWHSSIWYQYLGKSADIDQSTEAQWLQFDYGCRRWGDSSTYRFDRVFGQHYTVPEEVKLAEAIADDIRQFIVNHSLSLVKKGFSVTEIRQMLTERLAPSSQADEVAKLKDDGLRVQKEAIDSFANKAKELEKSGRTNSALDSIYKGFNAALRNGDFDAIDLFFSGLKANEYTTDLLLGILTATLPAKSRLKNRAGLFTRVKAEIQDRGEYEPGLLDGLES
jgi:DNA-binding transcriptional MerR regulator